MWKLNNNLQDVFRGISLIGFGETHHGQHDRPLGEILNFLKPIKKFFLEEPIDCQSPIDEFLKTGRLGERLERQLAGAAEEGKNVRDTFELARQTALANNCSIVCVDSSKTKTGEYQKASPVGHYFLKAGSRDEDMANNIFDYFFQNQVGKEGRSVFLGGSQHLKYGHHFRSGEITLGSRLSKELDEGFVNVCLWRLAEEELNFSGGEVVIFDVRNKKAEPRLAELMAKHKASIFNEQGELYFDFYLAHHWVIKSAFFLGA